MTYDPELRYRIRWPRSIGWKQVLCHPWRMRRTVRLWAMAGLHDWLLDRSS